MPDRKFWLRTYTNESERVRVGVAVDLGNDLACAELVKSGYDSLVEVMIPEGVGHIRAEGGIALEKTGRNVSRDYNICTVGCSCKFGRLEQILKFVLTSTRPLRVSSNQVICPQGSDPVLLVP